MALISLKDLISVSNNGLGLPIDIRQQVDEYTDIFNLYQCYPGMRIYVKHDTTSKALTYPKGIYIVKSIYSGTGKPNLVEFIEDYLHISNKVNKPLDTPTTGNFVSFDENGNAVDSNCNTESFAPIANAMPLPQLEDEGKILGYEAPTEGANPVVGWVDKPVDGDDAYGVYVKQYDEQHPEDPEHQSQDFMSRGQWLEYIRGKSAREIYNATYNKNLNDAQFAAELKMNYPMLHVGYNESNAGETVGIPFTGNLDPSGDNIGADETTMGKLYLMPDAASDPENCIGFVTVLDGQTYKWCNVGAIRIPSDVLAKTDVDNECVDGATNEPASANALMQLRARTEGITIEETKVDTSGLTLETYAINGGTGEELSTSAHKHVVIDCEGYDYVRFLAQTVTSSSIIGYAFKDENEVVLYSEIYPLRDASESTNKPVDFVAKIPVEAKYLYASILPAVVSADDFYCYLQKGITVNDKVEKELEDTFVIEEVDLTSISKYRNAMKYSGSAAQWGHNDSYRYVIPVVGGERFVVENTALLSDNVRFALLPEADSKTTHTLNTDIQNLLSRVMVVYHGQSMSYTIPKNIPSGTCFNLNAYTNTKLYKKTTYKEEIDDIDDRVSKIEKEFENNVDYNWESLSYTNNPGVISQSSKTWQNSVIGHYVFEIPNGTKFIKITKKSTSTKGYYTFFSAYSYTEGDNYPTSTYATGYTTTKTQTSKELIIQDIPDNTVYLYTNQYAEKVEVSYKKTTNIVGGFMYYSDKRIKEQTILLQNNSVTNYAIQTDANGNQLPTSRQMRVLLQKADKMLTFPWTPKVGGRIRKSYSGNTEEFYDATEQTGIPYSGNKALSVGFGISLYTFRTAIDNKYSLMYTEHLQDAQSGWNVLDETTYGKVRHEPTNDHCRCYYGSYCNGFVAMCTGVEVPIGCGSYAYNAKYYDIVTHVANDYKDIRIGDVFSSASNPTHTRLVTGVKYNEDGDVVGLEITEATGGVGKRGVVRETKTSRASVESYLNGMKQSYGHYRVNEIYRNWDINDMLLFDEANYTELKKVCTFAGDKATFLKGEMVVINFDLDENETFNETHLHLDSYVDGEWTEVTQQVIANIVNQDYPSFGNYVDNYKSHCWAIPQNCLEGGIYRVYVNSGTASSEPSEATYFEVLTEDYNLTGEGDNIVVKYNGNGELYGSYLYVYEVGAFSYLPLSDEEKEGQYSELHPETFFMLTNSKYNGQKEFAIRLFIRGEYGYTRSNIIPYNSSVESDL